MMPRHRLLALVGILCIATLFPAMVKAEEFKETSLSTAWKVDEREGLLEYTFVPYTEVNKKARSKDGLVIERVFTHKLVKASIQCGEYSMKARDASSWDVKIDWLQNVGRLNEPIFINSTAEVAILTKVVLEGKKRFNYKISKHENATVVGKTLEFVPVGVQSLSKANPDLAYVDSPFQLFATADKLNSGLYAFNGVCKQITETSDRRLSIINKTGKKLSFWFRDFYEPTTPTAQRRSAEIMKLRAEGKIPRWNVDSVMTIEPYSDGVVKINGDVVYTSLAFGAVCEFNRGDPKQCDLFPAKQFGEQTAFVIDEDTLKMSSALLAKSTPTQPQRKSDKTGEVVVGLAVFVGLAIGLANSIGDKDPPAALPASAPTPKTSTQNVATQRNKYDIRVGDRVAKDAFMRWWSGTCIATDGSSYSVRIDHADVSTGYVERRVYQFAAGEIKRVE